ncbi:hypothetical protein FHS51_001761 [Sphingobium wenxiniae]|uniref:Uncharacterized protein n=1 Tax=Sphingobium wenxiniae (strain DSM 21828 / CGMCC 1.7748 / JZ-1) TaxID=595605 RepID=A0A562KCN3_SPHWJ|nr:hypothetical protein [Sphingobium wenxiniae]MBB6191534.1 hypothetical protein [Sphingobium wenxiniae]TWH93178.1 hypothetical protein IQ35_02085 [Sphingobium wenxiniae]
MSRSRHKGASPLPRQLDSWSVDHPVAHAIRTGDRWFGAWQRQTCIPEAKLSRLTGIPVRRFAAIEYGGPLSRAELRGVSARPT